MTIKINGVLWFDDYNALGYGLVYGVLCYVGHGFTIDKYKLFSFISN